MKSILTWILGGLVCVSFAAAQEPVLVRARISCLAWSDPITDLYYLSRGKPQGLQALPLVRTGPYAYVGPATLQLFRGDAPPAASPAEPASPPLPVCTVQLPEQGGDFLLLLNTSDAQEGKVLAQLIPEPTGDFPAGACRFINLTESAVNIAAAVDEDVFILGPGEIKTVKALGDDTQGEFKLRFAYEGADGWASFYSGRWTQNPSLRTLFIILEVPKGQFILRRITDRPRS